MSEPTIAEKMAAIPEWIAKASQEGSRRVAWEMNPQDRETVVWSLMMECDSLRSKLQIARDCLEAMQQDVFDALDAIQKKGGA